MWHECGIDEGSRRRGHRLPLPRWYRDDFYDAVQPFEVVWIPGVHGKLSGKRSGGDQQIEGTTPPRLPTGGHYRSVDPSVGAGYRSIDRQGLEGRLRSLQGVLAPGALRSVRSRVRSGRELRERNHRDCKLGGQIGSIDLSETDDD